MLSCGPAPNATCATNDAHGRMRDTNRHGDRHYLECMGSVKRAGQGTGTVNQGFESAPAIVVVFHVVNGIFQDITVTPTKDASSTPPTTASPDG